MRRFLKTGTALVAQLRLQWDLPVLSSFGTAEAA